MCAEYTPGSVMSLQELFEGMINIRDVIQDIINERVFPQGKSPLLVFQDSQYRLIEAEFGLIPPWWKIEMNKGKSKKNRPLFATYNARLETIDQKKSFAPYFGNQHCLVYLNHFFESSYFGERFAGNRIKVKSSAPLFAAGIFTEWMNPDTGELLPTFTIVTHNPPQSLFDAGHDRCPIFLSKKDAELWLREIKGSAESKNFCQEKNNAAQMEFEITVDRKLAAGWEKRAPSPQEIESVTILSSVP